MEVAVLVRLKMIFCLLLLLGQSRCLLQGHLPQFAGGTGSWYQQRVERGEKMAELTPSWRSEDYSVPQRRRHVHNNLDP
ncbi:conserved hypothetical protein [Ricinus communis]|uniref:Uncharacterized protein n=1 Tax=Ricinus communis TaxID=3988 RepID=B9SLT6_RICCO|nr:conserved hypothetical protein [Ricinus communis]